MSSTLLLVDFCRLKPISHALSLAISLRGVYTRKRVRQTRALVNTRQQYSSNTFSRVNAALCCSRT